MAKHGRKKIRREANTPKVPYQQKGKGVFELMRLICESCLRFRFSPIHWLVRMIGICPGA